MTHRSLPSEPDQCFFLRRNWMCLAILECEPALFAGVCRFFPRRWRSRPSLLEKCGNSSLPGFFWGALVPNLHKAAPRNLRCCQKGLAIYNREELVQIGKGLWLQFHPYYWRQASFFQEVAGICLHGKSFSSHLKHLAAVSQGDQFLSSHADYFWLCGVL